MGTSALSALGYLGDSPRVRYQRALAVAAVAVFFTNADLWFFEVGAWPLPPKVFLLAFAALSLPLLGAVGPAVTTLRAPLLWWMSAYLVLSSVAFFLSSQSPVALQTLTDVFTALLFLAALTVIFSDGRTHDAVRRTIAWAVVLAAALNLYDLLQPLTFSPFLGRSAGLYINPNISGSAIVFGMILALDAVPSRLRHAFVLLAGLAVLLTVSRAAILGWVLVVIALLVQRRIRVGRMLLLTGLAVLAVLAALAATGYLELALQAYNAVQGGQLERLDLTNVRFLAGDESTGSRLIVARLALALFAERPFLGHGLAATLEWDYAQPAHNMYLEFLAESGILGLAIFPAALVAALWRAPARLRPLGLVFGLMWLEWGFFSNNVLEERHTLMALALMASLVMAARADAAPPAETTSGADAAP